MYEFIFGSWKLDKHNLKIEQCNLLSAVRQGDKERALESYQRVIQIFEAIPLSVVSGFQKMQVNAYKKKLMAKLEKALSKQGWLDVE